MTPRICHIREFPCAISIQLAQQLNLPKGFLSLQGIGNAQTGMDQFAAGSGIEADGMVSGVGSLVDAGHGLLGVCKTPKQADL